LLDQEDVSCAVIKARDAKTTHNIRIPNEHVVDLVKAYPKRFIEVGGVDPCRGNEAV
jgi:predicted TIM-barrel fold metal-dependent hydrolase